ncbi:hypothetical protein QJS04_geneDACA024192 [Acorus gramineus]|uniref:Uncharacterized protein n=1 Tax=Acorus gramineus TaxID=55184 RepID=A0AAV8ZXI5_ACOGR|nr:hypothetical protein QJS04_geneDACA024192 [Acorus gramineus]
MKHALRKGVEKINTQGACLFAGCLVFCFRDINSHGLQPWPQWSTATDKGRPMTFDDTTKEDGPVTANRLTYFYIYQTVISGPTTWGDRQRGEYFTGGGGSMSQCGLLGVLTIAEE